MIDLSMYLPAHQIPAGRALLTRLERNGAVVPIPHNDKVVAEALAGWGLIERQPNTNVYFAKEQVTL
jgi:uncharacterized protein (DUF427 family)